ncbi:YveK family protein [Blastococcus sp. SYSU DS0617]
MELRDYLAALRRYWTTWVGVTLVALSVALLAVLVTTPTYEARATVFVAAAGEGSSGAQFIKQRVTSYPDVARSEAVLGPVISATGLTASVAELRARVSAVSPLDSSQIDITVVDTDPVRAASTTNAIAEEFRRTVEQLEQPDEGATPVSLTVTDPANVPSAPVAPQPTLLLGLGLVVGLALGAAVAVLRGRTDTRVHTESDVREAWGTGGEDLAVFAAARGNRRATSLSGRPASLVARRLAAPAADQAVHALVLGATPDDDRPARLFAEDVATELIDGGVPAQVTSTVGVPGTAGPRGVQLSPATPTVPLADWRRIAQEYAGVVVVAEAGLVDRADLHEIRAILTTAGIRPLAVVLLPRRGGRTGAGRTDRVTDRQVLTGRNLLRVRKGAVLTEH